MRTTMISAITAVIMVLSINTTFAQSCCGSKKKSCDKSDMQTQNTSVTGQQKDSLKVYGLCGMCKTRIEKAAKSIKGIKDASWNSSTDMLAYTYDGTVKKEDVSNAMNAVGHDTELGKAPDNVYNELPGCCKYRD